MDKIISLINMDGPLADKETARQVAKNLFEYYDKDSSGTIEKHEMGKISKNIFFGLSSP